MSAEKQKDLELYLDELKTIVKKRGLKYSSQREQILKVLFNAKNHLTPEEIYQEVKKENTSIGLATVYRTLSFLESEDIVSSISFGSEGKKYELNRGEHHDHMICIKCGKIIEFFNEELERLQEEIAKKENFKLITHQMNMYGICEECQKKDQ
ncbi:Fur family transcriptional regulator, ferric uptake regulator [Nitratiruptor sp. YY08-26]|uniref:Fur family transcriptional regulator n=1 Tax=unclassified Nitratiruptor TaxID=2624044 RepID=UPI00191520BF|nr:MULTISPECIES: transcriptional repressor [unclassified Nitratiruptor]BCD62446.1 Fur family transcriptional regulator, ferric uptake regulator [Nitratiruptor sp. YY08-13]BCD66382.1 Fur family transcriptional regulator, ferric uptake regulator [Nitratiruptor sp. YY08-26]